MSLLDILIAAAREGHTLDTTPSAAPTPAPVDAEYKAYLAQVDAVNAQRRASCKRCGGAGYLREYAHINGGVCFRCGGASARVDPAMSYPEWLKARAEALELHGFEVMVRE